MKPVGKQLQEARLAKNWTPELAARETKIKVARIRDLEADDYTNFTSPAYARGFVRTYARALGMDEYKLLRQLDHKIPDDETPSLATESGVAYLPETSMPPRVAHRNYTGLYIVMGLGSLVIVIIAFVLFQAYRVGELPGYFAQDSAHDTAGNLNGTNTVTQVNPGEDAAPHALPVDPLDTTHAPKAEAVDLSTLPPDTNAAPQPPVALPVVPVAPIAAMATNAAPSSAPAPPRALPVDPSELTQNSTPPAPPVTPHVVTNNAAQTPPPPRALPVDPSELGQASPPPAPPAPAPATTNAAPLTAAPPAPAAADKRLVLTALRDSFVQVIALDPSADKPLYASVLHSGQSVGFDGRKFSVNVAISSAVGIRLDGVNYGPHSTHEVPETFTLESHQQ